MYKRENPLFKMIQIDSSSHLDLPVVIPIDFIFTFNALYT